MPLYTFYLCREDGTSIASESCDLDADEVVDRASCLLAEHRDCAYVEVWGSRARVLRLTRQATPSR